VSKIFLSINGEVQGPYSIDEIKDRLASKKISLESYAWKESFVDWVRLSEIDGLNYESEPPPPPKVANKVKSHESNHKNGGDWVWICAAISLMLLIVSLHYEDEVYKNINVINAREAEFQTDEYNYSRGNQINNSDNPLGELLKEITIQKSLPYFREGIIEVGEKIHDISSYLKIITLIFIGIGVFNHWYNSRITKN